MRVRNIHEEGLQFQIAPMIDVIFILILFFMCSAGAVKTEMHLASSLPGTASSETPVVIPDEQVIQITNAGQVLLNDRQFDAGSGQSHEMPELLGTLQRFRQASTANKTEAMVTITPQPYANYQRVIDVMNTCAAAQIKNVSFRMEEAEE
ncbi:MAG: biopolymer transporter ExbD [Terrimicrobiaceae bacterium]|nr:biopolymer transporter ExbD [Terrimicrobiaceae bacterium]